MTTYGRFGSFRASPTPQQRDGHTKTGNAALPQFCPVVIDGQSATDGRNTLAKAAEAAAPTPHSGVLIWEEPYFAHVGYDPVTRTASDVDTVPANTPAQRVQLHSNIKILVQNLSADDLDFDGMRSYTGRNMFKPADLAGLAVGDMVTPGAGNDTDGYWKKTADATLSWGRVAEVDVTNKIVVFHLMSR